MWPVVSICAENLQYDYSSSDIFNVDETGLTVVRHKHPKILTLKSQTRIWALTAAERCAHVKFSTSSSPDELFQELPPLELLQDLFSSANCVNGSVLKLLWIALNSSLIS
jgi:hypothetical protein